MFHDETAVSSCPRVAASTRRRAEEPLPTSALSLAQIETIGDAYCVAGGLHKKVDSHAKPIAHMALKMMELSEEVLTPDGKPIKVTFQLFLTFKVILTN